MNITHSISGKSVQRPLLKAPLSVPTKIQPQFLGESHQLEVSEKPPSKLEALMGNVPGQLWAALTGTLLALTKEAVNEQSDTFDARLKAHMKNRQGGNQNQNQKR